MTFEDWHNKLYGDMEPLEWDGGKYIDIAHHRAYVAWSASRKVLIEELRGREMMKRVAECMFGTQDTMGECDIDLSNKYAKAAIYAISQALED